MVYTLAFEALDVFQLNPKRYSPLKKIGFRQVSKHHTSFLKIQSTNSVDNLVINSSPTF